MCNFTFVVEFHSKAMNNNYFSPKREEKKVEHFFSIIGNQLLKFNILAISFSNKNYFFEFYEEKKLLKKFKYYPEKTCLITGKIGKNPLKLNFIKLLSERHRLQNLVRGSQRFINISFLIQKS